MVAKRKVRTSTLEKKLLHEEDIHIDEYHGRVSAWDYFEGKEQKKFDEFIKKYFKSLCNKHVRNRVSFIEQTLRRRGYHSVEELFGDIETTMNSKEQEELI